MRKSLSWLLTFLSLSSVCCCTVLDVPKAKASIVTEPVNKVIYTIPGSIDPLINRKKTFEFYSDGTVRFSECEMFDMKNGMAAYPSGQETVLKEYTFSIPKSCFSALEKEIYQADFFSLPQDLGVYRTDTAYTYLTVETNSTTHTCGGTDWPSKMDGIAKTLQNALNQAFFEDSRKGDYTVTDATITHTSIGYNLVDSEITVWETTLKGDGTATVYEYGPYPHPLIDMSLDFSRDEILLRTHYTKEFDIALFNALLLTIQGNGFLDLPDNVPGMDNGVPIDLSNSNQKEFIAVNIDGTSYIKSFMGMPSYYAPTPYADVLETFGEVLISTPKEAPPNIEDLMEW